MPEDQENPRQVAHWASLSQVGFEMAAPIGLGAFLDVWLGLLPWLTIVGAVLGLAGGLFHLVTMTKHVPDSNGSAESKP